MPIFGPFSYHKSEYGLLEPAIPRLEWAAVQIKLDRYFTEKKTSLSGLNILLLPHQTRIVVVTKSIVTTRIRIVTTTITVVAVTSETGTTTILVCWGVINKTFCWDSKVIFSVFSERSLLKVGIWDDGERPFALSRAWRPLPSRAYSELSYKVKIFVYVVEKWIVGVWGCRRQRCWSYRQIAMVLGYRQKGTAASLPVYILIVMCFSFVGEGTSSSSPGNHHHSIDFNFCEISAKRQADCRFNEKSFFQHERQL